MPIALLKSSTGASPPSRSDGHRRPAAEAPSSGRRCPLPRSALRPPQWLGGPKTAVGTADASLMPSPGGAARASVRVHRQSFMMVSSKSGNSSAACAMMAAADARWSGANRSATAARSRLPCGAQSGSGSSEVAASHGPKPSARSHRKAPMSLATTPAQVTFRPQEDDGLLYEFPTRPDQPKRRVTAGAVLAEDTEVVSVQLGIACPRAKPVGGLIGSQKGLVGLEIDPSSPMHSSRTAIAAARAAGSWRSPFAVMRRDYRSPLGWHRCLPCLHPSRDKVNERSAVVGHTSSQAPLIEAGVERATRVRDGTSGRQWPVTAGGGDSAHSQCLERRLRRSRQQADFAGAATRSRSSPPPRVRTRLRSSYDRRRAGDVRPFRCVVSQGQRFHPPLDGFVERSPLFRLDAELTGWIDHERVGDCGPLHPGFEPPPVLWRSPDGLTSGESGSRILGAMPSYCGAGTRQEQTDRSW